MAQRKRPSYPEWPVDRSVDTPYSVVATLAFSMLRFTNESMIAIVIVKPYIMSMNGGEIERDWGRG